MLVHQPSHVSAANVVTYHFEVDYVDKERAARGPCAPGPSSFLPILELLRYEETKRRLDSSLEPGTEERFLSMEMEIEDPRDVGSDMSAVAPPQFSAPRALSSLTALAVDDEVVLGSAFNSDHMVTLRVQGRSSDDHRALDVFRGIPGGRRKLEDSPLGTESSTLVVQTPNTLDSCLYF